LPDEIIVIEPYSPDDPISSPYMETRFFPIGWSKNNKFAFMTYFEDHDASGLVWSKVVIIDIVTDEILEQKVPEYEYELGTTAATIWKENKSIFSNLLSRHAIIPHEFTLSEFPLYFEDDTVDYYFLEHWMKDTDEDYMWPCIDTLTLRIRSAKHGLKTVYSKHNGYSVVGAWITGYFRSPYTTRIVIPLILLHPGWEGPPNTTSIQMVGCHLTTGFKEGKYEYVDAYFRDIWPLEGTVTYVFEDEFGEEVLFEYIDIDRPKWRFCITKEIPGQVLPEFTVNSALLGRKFRLYYTIEPRVSEFVGTVFNAPVIKKIEELK
jgi:hypothetical protein